MSDLLHIVQLRTVAQVCGATFTVRKQSTELLSQLLVRYLRPRLIMQVCYINESSHIVELALSAKDIATLEGRTCINTEDVLKVTGSFQNLRDYVECEGMQSQTSCAALSHVTARKRPKLRPTLAEVREECPKYVPTFLPVMHDKTRFLHPEVLHARTQGTTRSSTSHVFQEQLVGLRQGHEALSRESGIGLAEVKTTSTILRADGNRALRGHQAEKPVVSKADGLISGSFPVLDNF